MTDRVRPAATWPTIEPGTAVVGIDGYPIDAVDDRTLVVAEVRDGTLVFAHDPGATVPVLYPDAHESVTVRVDEPFHLSNRDRAALRRNRQYVPLLRSLLDGPRLAGGRGEGVSLASMSDVYGYGWTERGPRRTWQITDRGREALAAYDREHPHEPRMILLGGRMTEETRRG